MVVIKRLEKREIEKYLNHVLENFTDEQFGDLYNKEYSYKEKIKQKIKSLSEAFSEKKLKDFLDPGCVNFLFLRVYL